NENFEAHGDIGEIWFGEDSVEKIVDWVLTNAPAKSAPILDIGCGNGHVLLELAGQNFTDLVGIDYSSNAIRLANDIAKNRGYDQVISYYVVDLLDDNGTADDGSSSFTEFQTRGKFKIILDKGTFDAISLASQTLTPQCDVYSKKVQSLLDPDGFFLITSCNFTQDELVKRFSREFDYFEHIKYPTFTFGGVTGQTISTVAFKPKL
ncbi:18380_t:CDS:2, partial [Acaulospora morrowiae]